MWVQWIRRLVSCYLKMAVRVLGLSRRVVVSWWKFRSSVMSRWCKRSRVSSIRRTSNDVCSKATNKGNDEQPYGSRQAESCRRKVIWDSHKAIKTWWRWPDKVGSMGSRDANIGKLRKPASGNPQSPITLKIWRGKNMVNSRWLP